MKKRIAGVVSLLLLAGALVGAAAVLSKPQDIDVSTTVGFVSQTRTVGTPIVRSETEFTTVTTRVFVENVYDAVTVIRPAQDANAGENIILGTTGAQVAD